MGGSGRHPGVCVAARVAVCVAARVAACVAETWGAGADTRVSDFVETDIYDGMFSLTTTSMRTFPLQERRSRYINENIPS